MNPREQLQRLLRVKAAFSGADAEILVETLARSLPLTTAEHERAERGLTSEGRFADVFAALDWAVLIHGLEQRQLPTSSKDEWQVPDHLVFVRTPDRDASPVLVETKLVSGDKITLEVSLTQMRALEKYGSVFGVPVLFSVFWEKLHLWTTHTPDQFTRVSKFGKLKFDDAIHGDVSVIFSDTLLLIDTKWQRKITFDPTAEGCHLRHPERGFLVDDHLAVDGENFVQLTEVESGIINKIMRYKVVNVEKDGARSTLTVIGTTDSVAKASSIVHLLLEEFEAFGEESEPARAFNTLVRLKLNVGIPIRPYLPPKATPQMRELFLRTFGFSWPEEEKVATASPDSPSV